MPTANAKGRGDKSAGAKLTRNSRAVLCCALLVETHIHVHVLYSTHLLKVAEAVVFAQRVQIDERRVVVDAVLVEHLRVLRVPHPLHMGK